MIKKIMHMEMFNIVGWMPSKTKLGMIAMQLVKRFHACHKYVTRIHSPTGCIRGT
jgi:hypothetical protein